LWAGTKGGKRQGGRERGGPGERGTSTLWWQNQKKGGRGGGKNYVEKK